MTWGDFFRASRRLQDVWNIVFKSATYEVKGAMSRLLTPIRSYYPGRAKSGDLRATEFQFLW